MCWQLLLFNESSHSLNSEVETLGGFGPLPDGGQGESGICRQLARTA